MPFKNPFAVEILEEPAKPAPRWGGDTAVTARHPGQVSGQFVEKKGI
jgi:hypothetical protein